MLRAFDGIFTEESAYQRFNLAAVDLRGVARASMLVHLGVIGLDELPHRGVKARPGPHAFKHIDRLQKPVELKEIVNTVARVLGVLK